MAPISRRLGLDLLKVNHYLGMNTAHSHKTECLSSLDSEQTDTPYPIRENRGNSSLEFGQEVLFGDWLNYLWIKNWCRYCYAVLFAD